jgi:hypothetical protein
VKYAVTVSVQHIVDESTLHEGIKSVGSGSKEGLLSKRGAQGREGKEFFVSWFIIYIIHIIRRYYIIESKRSLTKIRTRSRENGSPFLPAH